MYIAAAGMGADTSIGVLAGYGAVAGIPIAVAGYTCAVGQVAGISGTCTVGVKQAAALGGFIYELISSPPAYGDNSATFGGHTFAARGGAFYPQYCGSDPVGTNTCTHPSSCPMNASGFALCFSGGPNPLWYPVWETYYDGTIQQTASNNQIMGG